MTAACNLLQSDGIPLNRLKEGAQVHEVGEEEDLVALSFVPRRQLDRMLRTRHHSLADLTLNIEKQIYV